MKKILFICFIVIPISCISQEIYKSDIIAYIDPTFDDHWYKRQNTEIHIKNDTIIFKPSGLDKEYYGKWKIDKKEIDSNELRTKITYWVSINHKDDKLPFKEKMKIIIYQNQKGIQFIQKEIEPPYDYFISPLIERYIIVRNY